MSVLPDRSHTAEIVDMVSLLDTPKRRKDMPDDSVCRSATLLSVRQSLRYQASIGLDDLGSLYQRHERQALLDLMGQLRQLLNREFGSLRVHRYRQAFAVGHRDLENLIAGLLRVQFHARQLPIPASLNGEELPPAARPTVGWGVGRTLFEASNERLKRLRRG